MDTNQDGNRIPTNLRLLLILEVMAEHGDAMTPSAINQSIGLPKPSIHRLCQTLLDEGFVIRDPDQRRLRLARRARVLATGMLGASHVHVARHQVLKGLAEELQETVNFVVPEEDGMRYVDRVEAKWPLRVQLPVGSHVPFHCTASGKCFLASLPPRNIRRFLGSLDLSAATEQTITDNDTLAQTLGAVRRAGYATDIQEFIDSMNAVAVPVNGPEGQFIGALATHGPDSRLTADRLAPIAEVLKRGAARIAEQIC